VIPFSCSILPSFVNIFNGIGEMPEMAVSSAAHRSAVPVYTSVPHRAWPFACPEGT